MASVIEDKAADVKKLCQQFGVERLELFGSAATDQFDSVRSDVDFLVQFERKTPVQRADSYFGLLFAFEELFHRKVDLVEIDAIDNPYFLKAIQPTRKVLYVG